MFHSFMMKVFVLFLLSLSVDCVFSQETINYASLAGRVIDQTGGSVEGAVVSAHQLDTNITNTVETDHEGRFRLSYCKLGKYEVTVHHPGFTDYNYPVTLTVGAAIELSVTLSVGSQASNINVTADATMLETARTQIAGTVSQTEVRNMPLNGRNFVDLALLVPGVSPTNTASTQLFAETSATPGQGISVGGQRNFSNSFIVDGLSANDDAAGLSGTFYGLDVVNEFQVVTSGGQAEFGRALGGYVNMVTKSGANAFHGDVYAYLRNQRFNAANAMTNSSLPMTQAQYGGTFGGPIIRDRTFYFTNLEQRELNQDGVINIAPANVSLINSELVALGYRGLPLTTGLYPNPVHNTNFLGKIDHQFNEKDQLAVRYSLYDVNSSNSRGVGALSTVSAAAGLQDLDQTVALSNVATLSARRVNETRGQYTHSNLEAPPNDPFGPAVAISGVASFGTLSGSPVGRVDNLYEVVDNFSQQEGAHAFRAGVDFLYNDLRIMFPQSIRGSYSFSSLANFQKGVYNSSGFTQSFGNPVIPQKNPNVGFYVQDEWKMNSRLTLNIGVRYDLQFLKTIETDTNNMAPRAGFAWSPFASKKTVVRGSFGVFYDRVPLRALANALLSSGNTTNLTDSTFVTVSLSPTQGGAPVFPNILTSLPSDVLVNYSTMNRRIQNAYSEQGSLEIAQALGNRSTLSVSYQHLRGLHLIASVNQNVPTCIAAGTNNGCRPDPRLGNNKQYTSIGDSNYDGLQVSFVHRPVSWGSFRISYTYSKTLDNVGEFFFSAPINNFNIWQDYSRSDGDQRHRVVFDSSIHTSMRAAHNIWENFTHGFQLSGILQYYSPLPFNITTGSNTIQGTAARPMLPDGSFIGRNTGIGFDSFALNTRLSRTFALGERFQLQGIAEAFNALNHRNDLIPNATFGSGAYPVAPLSTFGRPTAVGDPRTAQLALRLTF